MDSSFGETEKTARTSIEKPDPCGACCPALLIESVRLRKVLRRRTSKTSNLQEAPHICPFNMLMLEVYPCNSCRFPSLVQKTIKRLLSCCLNIDSCIIMVIMAWKTNCCERYGSKFSLKTDLGVPDPSSPQLRYLQ